jgi:DNA-binding CsgD family transcriptional regulator
LASTTLARVVEQAAIEQADQAGFVCLTEVGTRVVVEPSHPLYAEAAVGRMSTLQRRAVTSDVARAVLADDQSSPTERLGATAALVGLGERAPLDRLVEAAQTAFAALDHELAVTVAEAAVSAGDEFEALLILGAAHSGAGRPDEAAHALERAVAAASSDEELARAAGRLSVHLVAHGRQLAEADRVLTDAAAQISDATALAFVAADRAKLAAVRGESVELGPISESDDELGFLNFAIVGAYVAAMSGDVAACRQLIARAAPLAIEHSGVLPWSGDLIRFSAAFVSLVSDGPVAAIDEATDGLAEALVSTPGTVGTWKFLLGLIEAVAGRHGDALTHLAAAADELSGHDLIGARPLSVSARAWSLAQVGDVDTARGLLDRCVETAAADGRVRIQVAIADAWCDAIEGVSQPVKHLVAAAETAHDDGQTVAAVLACNEALRLGGAGDVLPLLRDINRERDGWLIGFALRRARAEAERDAVQCRRLAGVTARRWPLAAAELFGRAATWARTDQSEEMVARDRLAAVVLSDKLGTHPVWTLRHIQSPLSARELAVATAVAKGDRTRDVAAAAGVSARTVENQLQSTYRKLGMRNRRELSAMFDQLV